jgi:hypothetical protein
MPPVPSGRKKGCCKTGPGSQKKGARGWQGRSDFRERAKRRCPADKKMGIGGADNTTVPPRAPERQNALRGSSSSMDQTCRTKINLTKTQRTAQDFGLRAIYANFRNTFARFILRVFRAFCDLPTSFLPPCIVGGGSSFAPGRSAGLSISSTGPAARVLARLLRRALFFRQG